MLWHVLDGIALWVGRIVIGGIVILQIVNRVADWIDPPGARRDPPPLPPSVPPEPLFDPIGRLLPPLE